jgi:succinoglycan biosynthesis transport protein ExoP
MSDQNTFYSSNLPPETVSRNLPAVPYVPRVNMYSDLESRYGSSENVKLRRLWQVVRKRLWMVIAIVIIATTFITIDTYRNKRLYQATATIEIGRDGATVAGPRDLFIQDEDYLYVTMNTSEVILKSAPLLEDVVVQQGLDRNDAFLEVTKRKSLSESLTDIAGKVQRKQDAAPAPQVFTATTVPSKSGSRTLEESTRLSPFVGILEGNLRVRPVVDTRAMTISFTHTDPELAARIANAIAQRFIETSFNKKIEKFTSASEWLDRSTRELKAKVERAEQALADYTKSKGIYSFEGKQTLISEKLAKLHDQATRAEMDRILKQSLHDQVLQGRVAQIPEAFADKQTADLQGKLDQLSLTAAELSVTYGPKYPRLAEINEQMTVLRDQIAGSRGLLEQKLRADYERAMRDEQSLNAALDQAKNEAGEENQRAIQYSILKQDVETTKALYTDFLQKTSQAYLEVAQQHSNIRMIAPARTGSPVDQHRQRTILFSMALSLVAGVGLAWLLDRLDDSIRNIDDVTRFTHLPALAVIPVMAGARSMLPYYGGGRKKKLAAVNNTEDGQISEYMKRARLMEFDGQSPAAESYRALRTGLLLSSTGTPPKKILLTSVRSSEGKTTTSTNVAISLSQLGSSVLLVDCDLRKPSVHNAFGISHIPGMSSCLAQGMAIEEAVQKVSDTLDVITAGPIPPNPSELLSSERMKCLIDELASRYDHVVIDSPPIGSVTDPAILSTMVDGVILVVHAGQNKRNAVQRAIRELNSVGAKIFGIVLNSVNLRREGYADYQYYYYGYSTEEK